MANRIEKLDLVLSLIDKVLEFKSVKGSPRDVLNEAATLVRSIHSDLTEEQTKEHLKDESSSSGSGRPSYSDTLKKITTPVQEESFKLIIKTKQNISSEEIKNKFKSNINPCEMKIGIKNLKCSKKGFLTVESNNKKDILKISSKLENCKDLSVQEVRKFNPRIIIKNIPEEINSENFIETLRQQNDELALEENELKLIYIFKTSSAGGRRHAVIETTPRARCKLLQRKCKLFYSMCTLEDFHSIKRCRNCCKLHHTTKSCRSEERICANCSGNHDQKDCTSNELKCPNCSNFNRHARQHQRVDVKHSALSRGWNDVGFHGSDQYPTPNLDALAYNGIILNRHYVQPTCTPSRAALLTGKYPIHTGMQGFPTLAAEPNGLPLDLKIMPEFLRDLGYRTHIIGKWHMGYFRRAHTPLQRGFESHLGYYNGHTGYYDYIVQNRYRTAGGEVELTGLDVRRNDTPAWDLVGKYSTEVWSAEATRLVRAHDESEPLFLYMAHNAVHASHRGRFLEAPQGRVNSFKYIIDPNRRTFAAMVSKMDDSVGELVEALREKGMLDNTIILFLSDNGAPTTNADYPNWGSNFPLRGAKETLWEGGVRSPSFIWSAAFQQNPRVSDQLIHITDWLPTLYTAAGGDPYFLPTDLDGVDQWRALQWNIGSDRSQALLNINERERSAGIVTTFNTDDPSRRHWKLIVGSFADGRFDGVYNDVRSPLNPPYDFKRVLNSRAYRSINTYNSPATKELVMKFLRDEATVRCEDNPGLANRVPDCRTHPCLFNLDLDPCERVDLAPNNTEIVQRLYNALKNLRRGLVPQRNQPPDLQAANPANFNNTWSTWRA